MSKVTLKKTGSPSVGYYGSKGRRMVTPASYDILVDGKVVGRMWGYSDTRISDGGSGHRASAYGTRLMNAGVRGLSRELMDAEILKLKEDQ